MARLNLIPKTESALIACSVNDTGLRKWSFSLYAGDEPWQIDADSITLVCSNGATVPCTVSNNTVFADCTEALAAEAGAFRCKLKITRGSEVLFTQTFVLLVERI